VSFPAGGSGAKPSQRRQLRRPPLPNAENCEAGAGFALAREEIALIVLMLNAKQPHFPIHTADRRSAIGSMDVLTFIELHGWLKPITINRSPLTKKATQKIDHWVEGAVLGRRGVPRHYQPLSLTPCELPRALRFGAGKEADGGKVQMNETSEPERRVAIGGQYYQLLFRFAAQKSPDCAALRTQPARSRGRYTRRNSISRSPSGAKVALSLGWFASPTSETRYSSGAASSRLPAQRLEGFRCLREPSTRRNRTRTNSSHGIGQVYPTLECGIPPPSIARIARTAYQPLAPFSAR
jgi:hypothetical protein